jgi:hypothetical protein
MNIKLSGNKFNPVGYWETPLKAFIKFPTAGGQVIYPGTELLELFDQEGYVMTTLEQYFADASGEELSKHYEDQTCLKRSWIVKDPVPLEGAETPFEGAYLNHSLLFERRAFAKGALEQLNEWVPYNVQLYKLIKLRPKWGIDFSVDYADREGNVMEVIHYEHDEFFFDDIEARRERVENIFLTTDWNDVAKQMLKRKEQWAHLDLFAQGDWKCAFLGIPTDSQKKISWRA